jgi:hypothetical protein
LHALFRVSMKTSATGIPVLDEPANTHSRSSIMCAYKMNYRLAGLMHVRIAL